MFDERIPQERREEVMAWAFGEGWNGMNLDKLKDEWNRGPGYALFQADVKLSSEEFTYRLYKQWMKAGNPQDV